MINKLHGVSMKLDLLIHLLEIKAKTHQVKVFEAISFGDMQKLIYNYVIESSKGNKDALAYARELARTTDDLWVKEFDDVYSAIKNKKPIDQIEDELVTTIMAVSKHMVEFFTNPMNHHSGYDPSKNQVKLLDEDHISKEDLHDIIEKIEPSLIK